MMESPRLFNGRNVVSALILFLASLMLVNGSWIGAAKVSAASGGAPLPDMLLSYAPSDLPGMFAALGTEGRAAYLSMNAVDFFFAGAYGIFFFVALGTIAIRLFPARPAARLAGLVGVAGALCDEAENVVFRLGASGARIDGPASALAAPLSTIKYCLLAASVAALLAGLLALAISAFGARASRS